MAFARRNLSAHLPVGAERSCVRNTVFPGIRRSGCRPVGGGGVRDQGEEFSGGGLGDRILGGGSWCAEFGDGGFGHSQAIAAFVAEGVYQEVLGQTGCGAQHELVQDAAGYGVSGEADDAAFEVG
ncbi:hypothetical protein ACFXPA_25085 [Amycolatopsis sp. NPDC059090]|uniref:hypothetical protein n=1 Tax=unclassified Amycolatopsis TaxID=2618356 RepID=UPI00367055BC